jgi:hypothetical protein
VHGEGGGVIGPGTTATAQFSRENSDDLLLNDIEKKVVKIRPMTSPVTQLAMYAVKRKATSQIQQYYLTDVLPVNATLSAGYTEPSNGAGAETVVIQTSNGGIFSAKETVIFPEVKGYNEAGTVQEEQFFMAYILKKQDDGKLVIKAANGKAIGGTSNSVPTLPANTPILRCGRAHNEIDMRTSPYAVVSTKSTQYLQIFRCLIEESTLEKIAKKEVEWEFSDLEEEAVFDMKRGMSKSFLLGKKSLIQDLDNRDVYTTGGIWWQAKKDFVYGANADGRFTFEELVKLSETTFTKGAGNKKKYFLVGSGLMTQLSLIKYADNQKPADKTYVRYGITFKEISTNFGTLYVVHDETFDEMGLYESGLIFDPTLLRKYSIYDLKVQDLDLRASGEKDVDARTVSEISGLVLQNPEAHIRVTKDMSINNLLK